VCFSPRFTFCWCHEYMSTSNRRFLLDLIQRSAEDAIDNDCFERAKAQWEMDDAGITEDVSVTEDRRVSAVRWAQGLLDDKAARVAYARNTFAEVDFDGSGAIDVSEAVALTDRIAKDMHLLLPPTAKVRTLLTMCDKSGDGVLQPGEFLSFFKALLESAVKHSHELVLHDRNGDSKLDLDEFRAMKMAERAGAPLGEEALRAEFAAVDTDGSGKVDMAEHLAAKAEALEVEVKALQAEAALATTAGSVADAPKESSASKKKNKGKKK